MSATLHIVEYTDPGCPFAWSAEPIRRRIDWLYGEGLSWELRMVGLAETAREYEERGVTAERQAGAFRRLADEHHMPIDTTPRDRVAATVPACRAVVAVRRRAPECERRLLRELRILHFSGSPLDEPETVAAAAQRAGLDADDLARWLEEPETEKRLREDLRLAREPTAAAIALAHKLSRTETGYRYTCPSYEITRRADMWQLSVPGFEPLAAYEVAIANLAPELDRRPDPDAVEEVLAWAGEPLATAEVAAVCGIELADARPRLGRVAEEERVGAEALWERGVALPAPG